jgi:hypothetical protein
MSSLSDVPSSLFTKYFYRARICRPFKETRNRFQPGGPVRQPNFSYRPVTLHRLAKSIPRNRFLGSINVYKYGLRSTYWLLARHFDTKKDDILMPTSLGLQVSCNCSPDEDCVSVCCECSSTCCSSSTCFLLRFLLCRCPSYRCSRCYCSYSAAVSGTGKNSRCWFFWL